MQTGIRNNHNKEYYQALLSDGEEQEPRHSRVTTTFSNSLSGQTTRTVSPRPIIITRNREKSRKRARNHSHNVESPPHNNQKANHKLPSFVGDGAERRPHFQVATPFSTTMMKQAHHFDDDEEERRTSTLLSETKKIDIKDCIGVVPKPSGEDYCYSDVDSIDKNDEWIDKLLSSMSHEELPTTADIMHSSFLFSGNERTGNMTDKIGRETAETQHQSESIPLVDATVSELGDNDVLEDDHRFLLGSMIEPIMQNRCHHRKDNNQECSLPTLSTIEVASATEPTCFAETEPTTQNRPLAKSTHDHESPFTALTTQELERIALWQLIASSEQTQIPMLLTLTSFPFRVVHANHAFYTENAFQVADMAKIIGMGIFTLIPRPNGAPISMAHIPSLSGVYKIDEIVHLKLPIDQSETPRLIPCKINVYAVLRGLAQHHEPQGYRGSSDVLHGGGLRYFAVHLTPVSSICQSQHTGHCQRETKVFVDSSNQEMVRCGMESNETKKSSSLKIP